MNNIYCDDQGNAWVFPANSGIEFRDTHDYQPGIITLSKVHADSDYDFVYIRNDEKHYFKTNSNNANYLMGAVKAYAPEWFCGN